MNHARGKLIIGAVKLIDLYSCEKVLKITLETNYSNYVEITTYIYGMVE